MNGLSFPKLAWEDIEMTSSSEENKKKTPTLLTSQLGRHGEAAIRVPDAPSLIMQLTHYESLSQLVPHAFLHSQ